MVRDTGLWLRLARRGKLEYVVGGIQRTVRQTFKSHPMRHETASEINRRLSLAVAFIETHAGNRGWGFQRALDEMPRYLRCHLDAKPYEPSTRQMWVADDGAIV